MAENTRKQTIATVGDRQYVVPERCVGWTMLTEDVDGEDVPYAEVDYAVRVVEGRAAFTSVKLTAHRPLTPHEMQRIPWGRLAEGAIEDKARSDGQRDPKEVHRARKQQRRTEGGTAPGGRYQTMTDDRLREIVALRDEAQALGVRWDVYAGERLGYNPAYLRRLYGQAKRNGLA